MKNKKKKTTIHPSYKEIEVTMTDGKIVQMRSTYFGNKMVLEIDPNTHPAWTQKLNYVNLQDDSVAKFNKRYSGLDDIFSV